MSAQASESVCSASGRSGGVLAAPMRCCWHSLDAGCRGSLTVVTSAVDRCGPNRLGYGL